MHLYYKEEEIITLANRVFAGDPQKNPSQPDIPGKEVPGLPVLPPDQPDRIPKEQPLVPGNPSEIPGQPHEIPEPGKKQSS